MNILNKKFPNIYTDKYLYTRSFDKKRWFEERVKKKGGVYYREWNPERSKLAAAIKKGISQIGIKEKDTVLYLGASHGYTVSFISDIIGKNGFIYAVEFSPNVARDLVYFSEQTVNIGPLLRDANQIDTYEEVGKVDIVFQDIAQKNQVQIFLKNINKFLKKDGFGLLAIKARSIDVTKNPKDIFKEVMKELEDNIKVVDYRILSPYEKDHALYVVKK